MVLRFLIRYLASNEHIVNKLADSYPIRRAARLVVYFFSRTKGLVDREIESGNLKDINLTRMRNLAAQLENRLKHLKENLEKQSRK